MKRERAIQHVEGLAGMCAEMLNRPAGIFKLRVEQLWLFGDLLDGQAQPDIITVALGVDLPAEATPWLGVPSGAQHWADATRLSRNPFVAYWRTSRAPVWNHRIWQPVLVWDQPEGSRSEVIAALRAGDAASLRPPEPTAAALRARLLAEQEIAFGALRASTIAYGDQRWRPGKLGPYADALFSAADGYLDLTDALI